MEQSQGDPKTGPRLGPIGSRLLIYGLLLVAGILFFSSYARRMTYPAPSLPVVPSPPPKPLQEILLGGQPDARLVAWLMEHDEAAAPVVLFFYGNAQNKAALWQSGLFHEFVDRGTHFVTVDYPGYGNSEGKPSEASLIETGLVAFDWVRNRFPRSPVVVAGWSLGAGVASQVATRRDDQMDGLVLISSWSSLPDVARVHFPKWLVKWLLKEEYPSETAAADIRSPALVFHGMQDTLIPPELGKRVADVLPAGTWVPLDHFGHNDVMSDARLWLNLERFLNQLGQHRQGVGP